MRAVAGLMESQYADQNLVSEYKFLKPSRRAELAEKVVYTTFNQMKIDVD